MNTGQYLLFGAMALGILSVSILFYWGVCSSDDESSPHDIRTDEEKENDDKFGGDPR